MSHPETAQEKVSSDHDISAADEEDIDDLSDDAVEASLNGRFFEHVMAEARTKAVAAFLGTSPDDGEVQRYEFVNVYPVYDADKEERVVSYKDYVKYDDDVSETEVNPCADLEKGPTQMAINVYAVSDADGERRVVSYEDYAADDNYDDNMAEMEVKPCAADLEKGFQVMALLHHSGALNVFETHKHYMYGRFKTLQSEGNLTDPKAVQKCKEEARLLMACLEKRYQHRPGHPDLKATYLGPCFPPEMQDSLEKWLLSPGTHHRWEYTSIL